MTAIGVVGLGTMGKPFATRFLDADYDVFVYDVNDAPVAALTQAGATECSSPNQVAVNSDVVVLSLPGPSEVRDVMLGADGVLDIPQPGTVVIDTTTSLPKLTRQLEDAADIQEVGLLSAPVSGGRERAEEGTLSVMVGGPSELVEICRPYLQTIGSEIHHVGEHVDAGHVMKLLNQYIGFSTFVTSSEAIALGEQVGLDMETMLSVLNSSSGRNFRTEVTFPTKILADDYDIGSSFYFPEKDVRLFAEFAKSEDRLILLVGLVHHIIDSAKQSYEPGTDFSRLYDYIYDQIAPPDTERP